MINSVLKVRCPDTICWQIILSTFCTIILLTCFSLLGWPLCMWPIGWLTFVDLSLSWPTLSHFFPLSKYFSRYCCFLNQVFQFQCKGAISIDPKHFKSRMEFNKKSNLCNFYFYSLNQSWEEQEPASFKQDLLWYYETQNHISPTLDLLVSIQEETEVTRSEIFLEENSQYSVSLPPLNP